MTRNRLLKSSLIFLSTSLTAFQAYADEVVKIENFIGTINWENGALSAEVEKNKKDTSIQKGEIFLIDGGVEDLSKDGCKGYYGRSSWSWGSKSRKGNFGGYKNLDSFPVLNLTFPASTNLVIENAIIFTNGRPDVAKADLYFSQCGNVKLGDVSGDLSLISRGSTDLEFGNAARIDIEASGSGDVIGGSISGEAKIASRGSSDVKLGDIGYLSAETSGSGDIEAGKISGPLKASSHGSGNFDVGDISGEFVASSSGSGDIKAGDILGDLRVKTRGSGDFEAGDIIANTVDMSSGGSSSMTLDDGKIENLIIIASGSSDVSLDADILNAELRASGSSDINLERVTGELTQKTSGSADISVSHRE